MSGTMTRREAMMADWDLRGAPRKRQRERTKDIIKYGAIGDFFVRAVESRPGSLALIVKVAKKKKKNFLIEPLPDWSAFVLAGHPTHFASLQDLLNNFAMRATAPIPVRLTSISPYAGAKPRKSAATLSQAVPGYGRRPPVRSPNGASYGQQLQALEQLAAQGTPEAQQAAEAQFELLRKRYAVQQARVEALEVAISHVRSGGDPGSLQHVMSHVGGNVPANSRGGVPIAQPGDSISGVLNMRGQIEPYPRNRHHQQQQRLSAVPESPQERQQPTRGPARGSFVTPLSRGGRARGSRPNALEDILSDPQAIKESAILQQELELMRAKKEQMKLELKLIERKRRARLKKKRGGGLTTSTSEDDDTTEGGYSNHPDDDEYDEDDDNNNDDLAELDALQEEGSTIVLGGLISDAEAVEEAQRLNKHIRELKRRLLVLSRKQAALDKKKRGQLFRRPGKKEAREMQRQYDEINRERKQLEEEMKKLLEERHQFNMLALQKEMDVQRTAMEKQRRLMEEERLKHMEEREQLLAKLDEERLKWKEEQLKSPPVSETASATGTGSGNGTRGGNNTSTATSNSNSNGNARFQPARGVDVPRADTGGFTANSNTPDWLSVLRNRKAGVSTNSGDDQTTSSDRFSGANSNNDVRSNPNASVGALASKFSSQPVNSSSSAHTASSSSAYRSSNNSNSNSNSNYNSSTTNAYGSTATTTTHHTHTTTSATATAATGGSSSSASRGDTKKERRGSNESSASSLSSSSSSAAASDGKGGEEVSAEALDVTMIDRDSDMDDDEWDRYLAARRAALEKKAEERRKAIAAREEQLREAEMQRMLQLERERYERELEDKLTRLREEEERRRQRETELREREEAERKRLEAQRKELEEKERERQEKELQSREAERKQREAELLSALEDARQREQEFKEFLATQESRREREEREWKERVAKEKLELQQKIEEETEKKRRAQQASLAQLKRQREALLQQQRAFEEAMAKIQQEAAQSKATAFRALQEVERQQHMLQVESTGGDYEELVEGFDSFGMGDDADNLSSFSVFSSTPVPAATTGSRTSAGSSKRGSSSSASGGASRSKAHLQETPQEPLRLVKFKKPQQRGGSGSGSGGSGNEQCTFLGNCTCPKCRQAS
ncbi:hypothetical protein PTSG_12507 [Salpingoeca rosetta]|uniref:SH2 domain-containing protein n=1 Tax=Salpingoeca rosetta (strain ATCC 50818 / BSB-021) TaxID=946362 RepID=F2UF55_SALR5|nr:uncharacterized protein PTSG_12507 [Salpingoeca rosetta]EGD75255.1 hypothetical protein PTSG_12507 [Salpingoeca rosetta]|eukprot:XP_004992308.1 hypothetical protein PTSG_12507 [Salpingoeca rosetta]